ncbi:MAG: hypothetical protein ACOX1Y_01285 [Zhaonellaceae bacterium]|jgi:hypothetical protein|nr:hypothetical protein [Clostridia bacterium]
MTTVQRRHRYARLYLCDNCIKMAKKYNDVHITSPENTKLGTCEVCRETKKLHEVFTTAFHYGI